MAFDLNPEQGRAVRTLAGPLLVLAGAGTGKTRVVTYRIADLIRHGIAPGRILAVTFTNKAAAEMQERIGQLLGQTAEAESPVISTFHSLCVRILRRHIRQLGYPERFAIYDRGDQESDRPQRAPRDPRAQRIAAAGRPAVLDRPLEDARRVGPTRRPAAAQTDKEHLAAIGLPPLPAGAEGRRGGRFRRPAAVHRGAVRAVPRSAAARRPRRFDHLLVDEYQDTNASQYRIVKALAAEHRNLCVVGDDDQSIYGWRGAEVEHILRFSRGLARGQGRAPGGQLPLDGRDPGLANRLIAFNRCGTTRCCGRPGPAARSRGSCQYEDENEEAEEVVGRDRAADRAEAAGSRATSPSSSAPTSSRGRSRRNCAGCKLPYVLVGGMSFFDRKEVRDILAYLKLLAIPQDEVSLLRIINTPPRGIGAKAVEPLMQQAVESGRTVWDVLQPTRQALPAQVQGHAARFVGR